MSVDSVDLLPSLEPKQGGLDGAPGAAPSQPGPVNETPEDTTSASSTEYVVPRKIDPDFYFSLIVFEVEDYLFRVPIHVFVEESDFFATLFKILPKDDPERPSATIPLPDTGRDEFRAFLKVLYPPSVAKTSVLSLTRSEWKFVLKLSTKWHFNNLRRKAISELKSVSAVEKIVLGRQYFISSWLLSGFTEIVDRGETISNGDAIAMDCMTAIELFRLREKRLTAPSYEPISSRKDVENSFQAEIHILDAMAEEQGFKLPVKTNDILFDDMSIVESSPFGGGGSGIKKIQKKGTIRR